MWTLKREFENGMEADIVKSSKEWALSYSGNTFKGRYIVMRCSKSKQKLSARRKQKRCEVKRLKE